METKTWLGRTLALIMAAVMILSAVACTGKKKETEPATDEPVITTDKTDNSSEEENTEKETDPSDDESQDASESEPEQSSSEGESVAVIPEGTDKKFDAAKSKNFVMHIAGNLKDFKALYLDGKKVDKKWYSLKEGSIIVTVSAEYLLDQEEGDHQFTVEVGKDKVNVTMSISNVNERSEKKFDHKWDEGKVTRKATCTEAGEMTYTCKDCSDTKTEEIPMVTHTAGNPVRENEVKPNCAVGGSYDDVIRCTVCGGVMSSTHHTTSPTGQHVAGEWTEHAGNPKTRTRSCMICGIVMEQQTWVVDEEGRYETTYKTVHHDAVTHEEDITETVWVQDSSGETEVADETELLAYSDEAGTKYYILSIGGKPVNPDLTDAQKLSMEGAGWQTGNIVDYFATLVPEHVAKFSDGRNMTTDGGWERIDVYQTSDDGLPPVLVNTQCYFFAASYIKYKGSMETKVTGHKTVVDREAWDEQVADGQKWIDEKGHWE